MARFWYAATEKDVSGAAVLSAARGSRGSSLGEAYLDTLALDDCVQGPLQSRHLPQRPEGRGRCLLGTPL